MGIRKKMLKKTIWVICIILFLVNLIAFFHAYKFTHFVNSSIEKTQNPKKLSVLEKGKLLLFGINNPRPENDIFPLQNYKTIKIKGKKETECWYIKTPKAKGTVIIFHGYSGKKSSMIDKSDEFIKLGYNTLLVDFMGSGGSQGNQTTIGFKEANQVQNCYNYIRNRGEKNIYLFGTSMGAVAILKAINDSPISPRAILLECPFGTMYKTVCARFKAMNIPKFPMASLLVFWGGVQNGFWAFSHNPETYAKNINCPVLLMYGEKDNRVSKDEINAIFYNLNNKKELKLYANAGHENYLIKYKKEWSKNVMSFLEKY